MFNTENNLLPIKVIVFGREIPENDHLLSNIKRYQDIIIFTIRKVIR